MSGFDFETAERKVKQFAEAVASRPEGRGVATLGADSSEEVASANALFDEVSDVDTRWHIAMFGGEIPWDEAECARLADLYRDWAEGGKLLLAAVEASVAPEALALLRRNLREVEGILTPDEEFFDHPKLVERQQEALDAYHRGETVEFEEMGD